MTRKRHIIYPLFLGALFALVTISSQRVDSGVRQVHSDGSIIYAFSSLPQIDVAKFTGGTFRMGAVTLTEATYGNELPAHMVKLSDFEIMRTEVTQELWTAVMGASANPSYHQEDEHLPVENVSWDDCQEFIRRINQMPEIKGNNLMFRLPTEAEWEYAARGGAKPTGASYAGSSNADEVAWYQENSGNSTHIVATKKGLFTNLNSRQEERFIFDLSGNVAEWVEDDYMDYTSLPQTNPCPRFSKGVHVYRGGSYRTAEDNLRITVRNGQRAAYKAPDLGFRLVLVTKGS